MPSRDPDRLRAAAVVAGVAGGLLSGATVPGVASGIAAAVTRRVPVSRSYPAVVVWGLTAAAVRTLPRYPAAGLAALAGAGGVLLAARGSR